MEIVVGSVAMEEKNLDFVLVPLGLVIMAVYHLWLFSAVIRKPKSTVVGLNALARKRWVKFMMAVSYILPSLLPFLFNITIWRKW